MKDQTKRDEQTLAITTALAIVVITFAIAILAIGIFGDLPQDFDRAFVWVTLVALTAGMGYLIRRRS